MRVLITGSNGFIGKNLVKHLENFSDIEVVSANRGTSLNDLSRHIKNCDFIFHLAGVNRPANKDQFYLDNVDFTKTICDEIAKNRICCPILFASSVQAKINNEYGRSKSKAEGFLKNLAEKTGNSVLIFRLPNVFGKWSKPYYNSVVATFCKNALVGKALEINDEDRILDLVFVDDLVSQWLQLLFDYSALQGGYQCIKTNNVSQISVLELAEKINGFSKNRKSQAVAEVASGLDRALYATYLSFVEPDSFSYEIPFFSDSRGVFAEIIKTPNSGQVSFFTANPGVSRGGHYHHTKSEKFLVVKGKAKFDFYSIDSGNRHSITVSGERLQIVETVPGWAHLITNIGEDTLTAVLWANEIYDKDAPDTIFVPKEKFIDKT